MQYEQERLARDLYHALSAVFAKGELSISGSGVNWQCMARRGERSGLIHCFVTFRGSEYLTAFKRGDQTDAWGRTDSQSETIGAVKDWLDGWELDDLYWTFDFVDRRKRQLTRVREDVVRWRPALGQGASFELRLDLCDGCNLWIKAWDRSCHIYFYGTNTLPDIVFHWDECEILKVQTGDTERLAAMLERWLCERAMPSEMAVAFPEVTVEPVAHYYEEGRPVEGEFLVSWDWIERFYIENNFPVSRAALDLIAQLRAAGYDRTLRAGQSLWYLIVSRSRRHGLRHEQPSIAFGFEGGRLDVKVFIGKPEEHHFESIALTPELDTLLKRLVANDID
jgi:hypothetical protein